MQAAPSSGSFSWMPGANATASGDTSAAAGSGLPSARPQMAQPGATAPVEAMDNAPWGAAAPHDAGAASAGPRVYVREDGILVRDHRRGDAPMRTAPIQRPRRGVSKVEPSLVIAVRDAMRPIVHQCTAEIPATSMDADPRLQGAVVISIAAEHLTVNDVIVKITAVHAAAESTLRDCVVQGVKQIALAVPGAADITDYTLTLPFRLRQ